MSRKFKVLAKVTEGMMGFRERLETANRDRMARNERIRKMAVFYRKGLPVPDELYIRGPQE